MCKPRTQVVTKEVEVPAAPVAPTYNTQVNQGAPASAAVSQMESKRTRGTSQLNIKRRKGPATSLNIAPKRTV